VTNGEAFIAASQDPSVWLEFTRLQNLLALPHDVLTDPAFVARVRTVLARGERQDPVAGPGHDDLAALAAAAVRRAGSTEPTTAEATGTAGMAGPGATTVEGS
jgi:hypothetical protein